MPSESPPLPDVLQCHLQQTKSDNTFEASKKNVSLQIFTKQPNESENMPPKVSVIVPNYNHARYLKARIDSILNQTFQDFELILLDDCSTDNSVELLQSYAGHPHVSHIVLNDRNTGSPFLQWQKGIGLAQGEYVWIAESDDTAQPDFLSTTVAVLDRHPQAALCYTGSRLIDEDGHDLHRDINQWGNRKLSLPEKHSVIDGRRFAARNLYWRNYIANASAVLSRADHLRRIDLHDCIRMRYSGDWLFWFHMALTGDVGEVYADLNNFRQHTQKVTVKAEHNGGGKREDIDIVARMDQQLPEIDRCRRIIRHGILYNRINKLPLSSEDKHELHAYLKTRLNAGHREGRLAHVAHLLRLVCPWIPTMKRDRV